MNNYFEGYYYKHQKGKNTIAFIPGISSEGEFIQIITNTASYHIPYIGKNIFDNNGIKVNINENNLSVYGEIKYGKLTPIKYDIMGIFKYFPMECRHGVVSMYHTLKGNLMLNGENFDFTNGIGYIEKDSGTSFPKSYLWVQSNNFPMKCSVMVSIAHIPFYGLQFKGCICVVYYLNKEYRLATYLGAKIVCNSKNKVILQQGNYRLEVDIPKNAGHSLYAPNVGKMTRTVHESPSCTATFKFYVKDSLLFNFTSDNTSFEFVE